LINSLIILEVLEEQRDQSRTNMWQSREGRRRIRTRSEHKL
jgi:hypothetical protein